jgi:outer membrane protein insertion porin family/translocation and assembly module TamA
VLDDVKVRNNDALDDDELLEKIATRESPRFFGLFPGVFYDYEIFDRYVLERDLERIERYYRARGYYSAKVRAARVFYAGRSARVHIVIEEGEPVLLGRLDVHGLDGIPAEIARRAEQRVQALLELGVPFEEEAFNEAEKQLLFELADQGFARARVKKAANVDLPHKVASAGFWVEPGARASFGEVRIQGLGPLPEEPVRRALGIMPGEPYSQSDIDEAERAILNLGVFASVDIEPDLDRAKEGDRVPLLVRLEPSRLRSVHLGGGVQFDSLKTDVHLTAGWEDRNFLGGMRRFQVETQPGVVLYPTRVPEFEAPQRLLPMARLRVEFREPGFIERRTNALVRAEGSVYPVFLSTDSSDKNPVVGYRDVRLSVGVERSYWKFYSALTHNVQVSSPFTYIGKRDADLGTVLVSYPELFSTFDLRDDALTPHKGLYASNKLQVAGVGGDAIDVKEQPELRGYIPITRRVTLAARATIGLLFASNYGDTVESNDQTGEAGDGVSPAEWVKDVQLMFLRGFFSGGPGSNRGYALREIGPHGVVPFYNPDQSSEELYLSCKLGSADYDKSVCDLPLGGFTLWEASLELRYPILGPLQGALFADTSDVAPRVMDFRLNRPHLSVGPGLRYETPIGPVRIDVGYRIPGAQAPESADEYEPNEIFGLPIAISFGIGESF